jgi:dodecin
MDHHVYKILELVGTSQSGVGEAIENALERAGQTIRNIRWFEVLNVRGSVEDGKVQQFQVTVKVGFTLDGDEG